VHGTTRRPPGQAFPGGGEGGVVAVAERGGLASFRESQRRVHRDGHVEVEKAYYSVPPEYVGQEVWARWDGRVVRVFNERLAPIALHAQQLPGKFSTPRPTRRHREDQRRRAWRRYLLTKVRRLGVGCVRWAEAMLQSRGVAGVRVLQGLLHLARKHPREGLEKACSAAMPTGAYRLRTVRALLKRQDVTQPLFRVHGQHPLIAR